MGTLDSHPEQSLFSSHINLERRVRPEHPLRQLHAAENLRPHLGAASAHLEDRGQLPLSQFTCEAGPDRSRCPQGHYLPLHHSQNLWLTARL